MPHSVELGLTIAVLVIELALLALCYARSKRPPDPLNPRIIPYDTVTVILVLVVLATLAHLISLLTGQQLQPRRRRGM